MFSVTARIRGVAATGRLERELEKAAQVTTGDLLQFLAEQQSDILRRTERGLDVDGRPFAPYNSTRPYYYYPTGKVGARRSQSRLRGARARVTAKRQGDAGNGTVTRSGLGLRFPSYQFFKRTYLGRTSVDLRGPRAPHMLQQIAMRAGGTSVSAGANPAPYTSLPSDAMDTAATSATLGIYGEAGARAAGHNSEIRPKGMPRRQFFAVSDEELGRRLTRLEGRITDRISKVLTK